MIEVEIVSGHRHAWVAAEIADWMNAGYGIESFNVVAGQNGYVEYVALLVKGD